MDKNSEDLEEKRAPVKPCSATLINEAAMTGEVETDEIRRKTKMLARSRWVDVLKVARNQKV